MKRPASLLIVAAALSLTACQGYPLPPAEPPASSSGQQSADATLKRTIVEIGNRLREQGISITSNEPFYDPTTMASGRLVSLSNGDILRIYDFLDATQRAVAETLTSTDTERVLYNQGNIEVFVRKPDARVKAALEAIFGQPK